MIARPTQTRWTWSLTSRRSGRDRRGCPPAPARPGSGRRQAAGGWRSAPRGRALRERRDRARVDVERVQEAHHELGGVSDGRRGTPTSAAVSSSSTQQATMPLRTSDPASAASCRSRSRRSASRPASTSGRGSRSSTSCLSGSRRAAGARAGAAQPGDEPEPDEQQREEEQVLEPRRPGRSTGSGGSLVRRRARWAASGSGTASGSVRTTAGASGPALRRVRSGPVPAASHQHDGDAERRHRRR